MLTKDFLHNWHLCLLDRFIQHTAEKSSITYEHDSQTRSMKDHVNSLDTGVSGLIFKSVKISGHVNKSF